MNKVQPLGVPAKGAFFGVLGITLVVLTGTGIRFALQNRPAPIDVWWHGLMALHRNGFADAVAQFLNTFGGTLSMTLVTVAVVALLLVIRRWRQAITIGLAVALASGLSTVLKIVIARPRPLDGVVEVGSNSFPSGHTTTAAALTFAIALAFPRVWTWAIAGVWVASMALSRTYLLVHWTSDVLAAAVLGASVALLVAAILTTALGDRWPTRPESEGRVPPERTFCSATRRATAQRWPWRRRAAP